MELRGKEMLKGWVSRVQEDECPPIPSTGSAHSGRVSWGRASKVQLFQVASGPDLWVVFIQLAVLHGDYA